MTKQIEMLTEIQETMELLIKQIEEAQVEENIASYEELVKDRARITRAIHDLESM